MRHIEKKSPIPEFIAFLNSGPHTNWDEIHDGNRYPGLYRLCRDQILMEEQNCMSGYTEMPLEDDGEIHIDHFKKKGMPWNPPQTFVWDNFIVDSLESGYGACHKDKLINRMVDYDKLINPVEEDPHDYFTYLSNGKLVPKEGLDDTSKEKAEFTCASFNLNCEFLRAKRESIMKMVEPYLAFMSLEETLSALSSSGFTSVIEYVYNHN